jgi:hypothetical protein
MSKILSHISWFVALWMRSADNGPEKMKNKQLLSPSRQCSNKPVGFHQGFLNKLQCDNARASPS